MKTLFYIGLAGLALFEIANVYFIMPMPGSQEINSLDLAYFLYCYRWSFRIVFILMILAGIKSAFNVNKRWIPAVAILPVLVIAYMFNFRMVADKMFLEPQTLQFNGREDSQVNDSTLVIAVEHMGEAKAYPVRYIVYHHQVRDTIANKQIMVTYCSVCRTGRVYEPKVNGDLEKFRLVGMDHFNAMFEDSKTGSWWQQSTGEAVAGKLKGNILPEIESVQLTANKFFSLYPFGKIMQPEDLSKSSYDTLGRFEKGKSKGDLTRTDSLSWKNKSWVIGIQINQHAKAFDWNELKQQQVINDFVGEIPVAIVLSTDSQSFAAFIRESDQVLSIRNDTIFADLDKFTFAGKALTETKDLTRIKAYQEFWHSWKTFHPNTAIYQKE